ncbi:OmpA family protein [Flavobacteriaceae sp. LMIT009]
MKQIVQILVILVTLLLCEASLFAQQTRVELGDRHFNELAYQKAMELYLGAIERDRKVSAEVYAKLADCYYHTSQSEEALKYYKIAFEKKGGKVLDAYRLRYAICLLSAGERENALAQYKIYFKDLEKIDKLQLTKVDTSLAYLAENLSVNSSFSDFGSTIFNDTLYYTSSMKRERNKNNKKHNKRLYKWTQHPFLDIYTAAVQRTNNGVRFKQIPLDSSNIKFRTIAHEASLAFINDRELYFSGSAFKNNKISYNKRNVSNLKIQKAKKENGVWELNEKATKELDFINLENFSLGNPAMGKNGKRLFFVSCAPYPQAKGQSDIYYVEINKDGSYGQVTNVPGINTHGRESFPYISSEGHLYFSSNGIHNNKLGWGLLDIYMVKNIDHILDMKASGQEVKVKVDHLGSPYNSIKDDFAFFLDTTHIKEGKPMAYFSSNRSHPQAKGNDDIYRARYIPPIEPKVTDSIMVAVRVTDAETRKTLVNAKIDLRDSNKQIISQLQLNASGELTVSVERNKDYHITAHKKMYYDTTKQFIATQDELEINLKMEHYPCEFTLYHKWDKNAVLIDSVMEQDIKPILQLLKKNRDIKISITSHTDSSGDENYNFDLSNLRAKATKDYLIDNGVAASQIISAEGQGETQLLLSDAQIARLPNAEERKNAHLKNRRSQFIIVGCSN